VSYIANPNADPAAVPEPSSKALAFHRSLEGYEPTPLRELPAVASELGLAQVAVKDESARLGLPAFKVLGASWAVERALGERPDVHTLVAASAGNHGRAVAHVAARRGLTARIYLPARAAQARRDAIAGEGAEVIVIEGTYEEAVERATEDGERDGVLLLSDVGDSAPARWVIDGYATLFSEIAAQREFDVLIVPAGVGSLAAAAARFGAANGATVIAVEPVTAACLTASLEAGEPVAVDTPGTTMAGLDCAEVSAAAWPTLRAGIHGTVTVTDEEAHAAMRELAAAGLAIGESGAAPLAALRALALAGVLSPRSRVVLIATEGPTDPVAYDRVVANGGAGESGGG
jgi:diaminopropionate ammonia-lyase